MSMSAACVGSSPLARGTPVPPVFWQRDSRFIPAGAGNTSASENATGISTVHPRWRGEHARWCASGCAPAGSSPLARGTQAAHVVGQAGQRFIPAGAGNTRSGGRTPAPGPVHPRWRGEHIRLPRRHRRAAGSSPLARGTLAHRLLGVHARRFIPAGAGNTARTARPRGWRAVHPRWRGEHGRRQDRGLGVAGSSPLARGTRNPAQSTHGNRRFIPAGAGNT